MGLRSLIVLGVVGLIAQLVDGSLGMAYGVTSTTLLLTVGIAPAVASAAVHLSEVGTTLASGFSHWRFGNVDWGKVGWMAVPGGVGAFLGAVVLSSISAAGVGALSPRRPFSAAGVCSHARSWVRWTRASSS